MGLTNRFRFELEDEDGQTRDCTPYNPDVIITGDRRESRFNWSYLLTDPIVLKGDDFAWIYALEQNAPLDPSEATRCGGVAFRIYETCNGDENLRFEYFANLNEAEFFPDDCYAKLKLQPVDAFSCIYRNWEEEVDVLDLVGTKYTIPGLIGYLELETCNPSPYVNLDESYLPSIEDSCLSDPAEGWVLLQHYWVTSSIASVGPPILYNGEAATIWVRERVDDSPSNPPGDGWIDIGGDSWVRKPEVYYYKDVTYYYNLAPLNTFVKYIEKWGKVVGASPNVVVDELDEYSFELNVPAAPIPTAGVEYSNGLLLEDVLQALLDVGCSLTVKSNFFRIDPDDPFPADEPYPTAAAGFDKIILWQLSDVVRYDASQDATDLKISLKDFLEDLRNTFNVEWTIEGGTVFRLEHISYFVNQNGENLTVAPWADYTARKNAYNYDSVKIPRVENFQFQIKTTPFFNGNPIVYTWNCASSEVKDRNYAARNFLSDLGYLHQVGENAPLVGMFIGAVIESGGGSFDFYFARENDPDGNPRNNGHLSFYQLLPNYWIWDRPQTSGEINGTPTTFETTFRVKRQQALGLPVDCDFLGTWDPTELMQTALGWGEVTDFQIDLGNCLLTIILLHDPNA